MNDQQDNIDTNSRPLRIFQQNVMKTKISALHLINSGLHHDYDIIALQEPYLDSLKNTRANHNWRVIYPTNKFTDDAPIRSVMLVNKSVNTNSWHQIDFPSNDVTGLELTGPFGTITILNIYNDCNHSRTLTQISSFYHLRHRPQNERTPQEHDIWIGDFNRHHPLWEDKRNFHLCEGRGEREAQPLIDLITDLDMLMALPPRLYTLRHKTNHNILTRPDNVFISPSLSKLIESCRVDYGRIGPGADHFPITTILNVPTQPTPPPPPRLNFKDVNWEDFREHLKGRRQDREELNIKTQDDVNKAMDELDEDIHHTIAALVDPYDPVPWSRRWWTKELSELHKIAFKQCRLSHKFRYLPWHFSHDKAKVALKTYRKEVEDAKRRHWDEYLATLDSQDMWKALQYATSPGSDGGNACIPTLKTKKVDRTNKMHATNEEKAELLSSTFFPPPPDHSLVPESADYPEPCCEIPAITLNQVERQIERLQPHKAPGPDGIPNIVIKKCSEIIAPTLCNILQACLDFGVFPDKGRISTTAVIRKPGKTHYAEPKAYRPIALLNTLTKVLSAVVANMLTYIAEKHQLLPKNHYGGRPGRTTTDALHYLVAKIRNAWSRGNMVGVLFLDIEGAFPNANPNANPDKLIHNMKMRRVPTKIINYTQNLLTNHKTKLRFDDYESDLTPLTNGIGQGCPLSMILYIFYNADFLEIPNRKDEDTLGFVDDSALLAEGRTQDEIRTRLKDMMERREGGLEWCHSHNSKLSLPKTTYLLATQKRIPAPQHDGAKTIPLPRLPIVIGDTQLPASPLAKYLGVFIDQELRWKEQASKAISKGTQWVLAYRRLTRQSKGVSTHIMRQLYSAVALPKILYAADVWIHPPSQNGNGTRSMGSTTSIRRLATIQRTATLAITGALRSTSNKALDAHTYVLPMHLAIRKTCFRALLRMTTLPEHHPLGPIVRKIANRNRTRHQSPIHRLLRTFPQADPRTIEKIPAIGLPPWTRPPAGVKILSDREEAIARARDIPDSHAYRLYTDGSGHNNQVGAAAVLYRYNEEVASLRYYLGPLTEHTVHEAEAVATTLGLQLLRNKIKGRIPGRIDIGIDNQAVLRARYNGKPAPGSHIFGQIYDLADKVKRRMEKPHRLRLTWVPGHEGIEGNERADTEAKKAAENDGSPPEQLPPYLRRSQLPRNKSAVMQQFSKTIDDTWKQECSQSHVFRRLHAIDPSMPSKSYLKLIAKRTRAQSSIIMQLRTGRIGLNRHLYQLSRSNTPQCPHCPHAEETVRHYLLHCPKYWRQRRHLTRTLRRKAFDLKTLLSDPKAQRPLLQFVAQSHRFEDTYGKMLKT